MNELYHHGVKGMRWGHRRRTERAGSTSNSSGKSHKGIKVARTAVNVYQKASRINTGVAFGVASLSVASLATSVAARSGKSVAAKYAAKAFAIGTVTALSSMAITNAGCKIVNKMLDRKEQKLNNK